MSRIMVLFLNTPSSVLWMLHHSTPIFQLMSSLLLLSTTWYINTSQNPHQIYGPGITQNNFELAGEHCYIQIHSTAMSTRMGPSAACLLMGRLEEDLLSSANHKPFIWCRYIDNVFLIWTHGQQELDNFITLANTSHPPIKFTSEQSNDSISFLDVKVTLSNGYLERDFYSKLPTSISTSMDFLPS